MVKHRGKEKKKDLGREGPFTIDRLYDGEKLTRAVVLVRAVGTVADAIAALLRLDATATRPTRDVARLLWRRGWSRGWARDGPERQAVRFDKERANLAGPHGGS